MPTIEKIQEIWTSGSITTLFRLCSKADIDTSLPLYSPIAGYKWSLLLSRAPWKSLGAKRPRGGKWISNRPYGPSECGLFFYCNTCHSAWHGAQVEVTLSFPSHPDGELANSPTSTALDLESGSHYLLTTCSTGDLGDALVSLEPHSIPRVHTGAREPSVPEALALRALRQSLKTGTSPDTIFQVYTRRLSSGIVTKPIPIYANATVLQATTLLPDFAEEYLKASSLFELPEGGTPPFTSLESYEYASDSDLDDEEGDNLAAVQPAEELAGGGEASTCHDEQSHTAQTQGDTTDSGSISSFSSFEVGSQEQPSNRMSLLEEAETMTSGSRVILVKGVAWKTWHAFVYYCYTGTVNFSSLRSQVGTDATLQQSPFKDDTPCCSPKSMYQLARKLQNDDLSQLAFKAIETKLSAVNILDEALSKFTARHEAVREMEIALLVNHRSEPDVQRGLSAKIEALALGNMPHAGPVLTAFCQRMAQMPSHNHSNTVKQAKGAYSRGRNDDADDDD